MRVVDCTKLADLYRNLGAAVWCSRNTGARTAEYHIGEAEKWLALITEARLMLFTQPVDRPAFRRLLVKYFESDLIIQVPYLAKLNYPTDWQNKELCKSVVEKWVNGDYD